MIVLKPALQDASALAQQACRTIDHRHVELARVEPLGGEGLMMRPPGSLLKNA